MRQNSGWLLFISVLICGIFCRAEPVQEEETYYVIPMHRLDDSFSSNWVAQVKSVLPPKYAKDEGLTFQVATNLLCREGKRGNYKAMGLWGFTKIIRSKDKESIEDGIHLMEVSADKGYVPAMDTLGVIFSQGKYVLQDYARSRHWYEMAATNGDAGAEAQVGTFYHYGLGVAPDRDMTIKYYRMAAEHTNYEAMKSLGYILSNGPETQRDMSAAKYWSERAAREGDNARAMYNLGVFAQNGSTDRKSTRLNSSHLPTSRMPSSA